MLFESIVLISIIDIITTIGEHYYLEHYIVDKIEVSYTTFIGNGGNTKEVVITQDISGLFILQYRTNVGKNITQISLQLENTHLKVQYQVGDKIERKCTCDSKYMLSAMRCLSEIMRLKYHWVPLSNMLYLVMDNSGVHGTDACVGKYHYSWNSILLL